MVYSAGSGMNRVVLSGFSVTVLCFSRGETIHRYGCMYLFVALVFVCVDVMVMSPA